MAIVFAVANPDILVGQFFLLIISLIGVIIFYIVYTFFLAKILVNVNPWIGALIMDWPLLVVWAVVLAHLPGIPPPLILAIFLYFGVSLVLAGSLKYGGCEVLAIPNLVLGKSYNVACIMFSPIDWVEAKIVERISKTSHADTTAIQSHP